MWGRGNVQAPVSLEPVKEEQSYGYDGLPETDPHAGQDNKTSLSSKGTDIVVGDDNISESDPVEYHSLVGTEEDNESVISLGGLWEDLDSEEDELVPAVKEPLVFSGKVESPKVPDSLRKNSRIVPDKGCLGKGDVCSIM